MKAGVWERERRGEDRILISQDRRRCGGDYALMSCTHTHNYKRILLQSINAYQHTTLKNQEEAK
jgi:hypothetical protein